MDFNPRHARWGPQTARRAGWKTCPTNARLIEHVAGRLPESAVRDRLFEFAVRDPLTPLQKLAAQYGDSGYVVESVPLSLFAAQQAQPGEFAGWLRGVVEVGGDTDTIASMAGQIGGCCIGAGRIPDTLVMRVPGIEELHGKTMAFARQVAALDRVTTNQKKDHEGAKTQTREPRGLRSEDSPEG